MAKDVDLSSKQWCDLVFDGKNKEFGAYELRMGSPARHNKAMIYTVLGLIIAALLTGLIQFGINAYEESIKDQGEQEVVNLDLNTEKPKEEEKKREEIKPKEEEKKEEPKQASVAVTELKVTKDNLVKNEVKPIKEEEQKLQIGQVTNLDGLKGKFDATAKLEEQVQVAVPKEEPKKEEKKEDDNKIFTAVEQQAEYPGGNAALQKYLSSHINYPTMAQENNIQGKCVVQFVVEKNGSVGEVKVVRSAGDSSLDNEAKRVVRSLKGFTPGRQNGHPVRSWFTLPVTFKLQN